MLAALLCNPLVRTLRVKHVVLLRSELAYVQADYAEAWVSSNGS